MSSAIVICSSAYNQAPHHPEALVTPRKIVGCFVYEPRVTEDPGITLRQIYGYALLATPVWVLRRALQLYRAAIGIGFGASRRGTGHPTLEYCVIRRSDCKVNSLNPCNGAPIVGLIGWGRIVATPEYNTKWDGLAVREF